MDCDDGMGASRTFTSSIENVLQSHSTAPDDVQATVTRRVSEPNPPGPGNPIGQRSAQRSYLYPGSRPRHGLTRLRRTLPRTLTVVRPSTSWSGPLRRRKPLLVVPPITASESTGLPQAQRVRVDDICGGTAGGFTSITGTPTDGPGGIVITAGDGDTDLLTDAMAPGTYRFYACVQADPTPAANGNDHGPWNMSSATTISIKAPRAPTGLVTETTATTITWTWNSVQSRSTETISYEVRGGPSCPPSTSGTAGFRHHRRRV